MRKLDYILIVFILLTQSMSGQNDTLKRANKTTYDSLIVKGDSLFKERYYFEAAWCYKIANEIDSAAIYPKRQLEKILVFSERAITYNKLEFNDVMRDARKYYREKDWVSAWKKYEEAFNIKPDCTDCLENIKSSKRHILKEEK